MRATADRVGCRIDEQGCDVVALDSVWKASVRRFGWQPMAGCDVTVHPIKSINLVKPI